METIKRYSAGEFSENPQGCFVFFDDHLAAVQELCEALRLCQHKIAEHMAGQYPNGQALKAAQAHARTVLEQYKAISDA